MKSRWGDGKEEEDHTGGGEDLEKEDVKIEKEEEAEEEQKQKVKRGSKNRLRRKSTRKMCENVEQKVKLEEEEEKVDN